MEAGETAEGGQRWSGARESMSAEDPLDAVMARYVAGDLRAFDALYERAAPAVFAFLLSMTRNRPRAEDLCQTTFMKLHRARSGWIPRSPVMPWVMAIARNTLYDDLRVARRKKEHLTASGDVPDVVDLSELAEHHEQQIDQTSAEMAEVLAAAMERLPERQREALVLTKQSGLSIREAALALGTTGSAVKLRVHRAYETLREALRKHRERET